MPQNVSHIFQGSAVANHLARSGMAEAMAPEPSPMQSNTLEKAAGDPGGRGGAGERLMGRAGSEEHFAIRAAWSIMLDIFAKDSADITGQRESAFAVSLRTPDVNHALVPIEVFKAQLARLAAAKSQPGQEQDEGTLAPCSSPRRLACGKHVFEFLGCEWTRKRRVVPTADAGNGPNQGG